jgi:hypothetical protein
MEAIIKNIDGKWTVNGKTYNELSVHEIGMLNAFFADWKQTTEERFNKICLNKVKELFVNDPIIVKTNVFDKAFDNPIEQLKNLYK